MKDIKYYLVDSENVNDNWLMLFELADETDRIIVFYTKISAYVLSVGCEANEQLSQY